MNNIQRFLALGLSAGILVSGLAGCSGSNSGSSDNSDNSSEYTEVGYTYSGDVYETVVGMSGDTVVGTVNGEDLLLSDLTYWLSYDTNMLAYYHGSIDAIQWDELFTEESTYAEYVLEDALTVSTSYEIIRQKAEELDLSLSDEQIALVEESLAAYTTSFGEQLWNTAVSNGTINEEDFDDEAKEAWIAAAGADDLINETAIYATTPDYLRKMNEIYYLNLNIQEYYFGENGTALPTDEDIQQYIQDSGYVTSQSILFMNLEDENGDTLAFSSMTDEQKAELKAKAEAALQDILSAEDQLATFNSYQESSDDTGSNSADATYTFTEGTMVDEFYQGVIALDEGEVGAELVESEAYGYFIIWRQPTTGESVTTDGSTIYDLYLSESYNTLIEGWTAESVVETNDNFDKINMEEYGANLLTLSQELYPSLYVTEEESTEEETASDASETTEESEAAE